MKRALLATGVLTLLLVSAVGAQTIRKSGRYTVIEIEKEFDVGRGGRLKVVDASADVTVTGWGGEKVAVHAVVRIKRASRKEAEEVARQAESACAKQGNTVVIEGDRLSGRDVNSRFEIRVPRQFD
ncbi:MAG: hypothetical protein GXO73_03750, partial [Calditrichaeota bacterium]|nr:hypothetical protein [Calditrichota bacterium]